MCKTYKCPMAVKMAQHNFIMCKRLMKDGVNYGIAENAKSCICGYQRKCPETNTMINTLLAKNCYEVNG